MRITALPLLRPSPPVPICSTLARRPPAVAVAVCFEENTALSRGWCMPLARGSAVCGAKRIAQHANPGLLSSPVRLSAFPQNVIKRNRVMEVEEGALRAWALSCRGLDAGADCELLL